MQIVDFYNNPNIGLFFYTTNSVTIIPSNTPESVKKELKNELKTRLVETNIYNTNVVSIFLNGNEEYLFAPDIISIGEKKILESVKELKIVLIKTQLNALGNNMIFYKDKAVINPDFEDSVVKQLESLNFKVLKSNISGVGTVGANLVIIGEKALINPSVTSDEQGKIEEFLGIECVKGSVNNNSNIVKAGLVVNKQGVIVSALMTGPEMMTIEELYRDGNEQG